MKGFITHLRREVGRMLTAWIVTIIPPLMSSLLYVVVFGLVLGTRISQVEGFTYIQFIAPGLIMMHMITGSYANTSGSIFMARREGNIEDILVSPLSYFEMISGYVIGGMLRGMLLGIGTYIIIFIFEPTLAIDNTIILLLTAILVTLIFSCVGIVIGLWADTWEQLNLLLQFGIMPLTFLGGVFYTTNLLPSVLQVITRINPIFYLVNALRYGMIGFTETNVVISSILMSIVAAGLVILVTYLFKKGYKLKV